MGNKGDIHKNNKGYPTTIVIDFTVTFSVPCNPRMHRPDFLF